MSSAIAVSVGDLESAFPDAAVRVWLRALGYQKPEVDAAHLLVVEVLNALSTYGLIGRPASANVFSLEDKLLAWAQAAEGQDNPPRLLVTNSRYVVLVATGYSSAIDMATGKDATPPDIAAPVVTAMVHLAGLRQQTVARLASVKKAEAT